MSAAPTPAALRCAPLGENPRGLRPRQPSAGSPRSLSPRAGRGVGGRAGGRARGFRRPTGRGPSTTRAFSAQGGGLRASAGLGCQVGTGRTAAAPAPAWRVRRVLWVVVGWVVSRVGGLVGGLVDGLKVAGDVCSVCDGCQLLADCDVESCGVKPWVEVRLGPRARGLETAGRKEAAGQGGSGHRFAARRPAMTWSARFPGKSECAEGKLRRARRDRCAAFWRRRARRAEWGQGEGFDGRPRRAGCTRVGRSRARARGRWEQWWNAGLWWAAHFSPSPGGESGSGPGEVEAKPALPVSQ